MVYKCNFKDFTDGRVERLRDLLWFPRPSLIRIQRILLDLAIMHWKVLFLKTLHNCCNSLMTRFLSWGLSLNRICTHSLFITKASEKKKRSHNLSTPLLVCSMMGRLYINMLYSMSRVTSKFIFKLFYELLLKLFFRQY